MGWKESASELIGEHVAAVRSLEIEASLAWWEANTSGSVAAFGRKEAAQNRLDEALGDLSFYTKVSGALATATSSSPPELRRQLTLIRLLRLEKQGSRERWREITAKANSVEQAFNVFRPRVNGEEWTDSRIRETLRTSRHEAEREAAWKASKEVGPQVEADLLALVKLRNEAARELGFTHYQAMALAQNEQDVFAIDRLFDELDRLTREPFARVKADIDEELAKTFGLSTDALQPWHYHDTFFQEAPSPPGTDLDAPYRGADIVELCRAYYDGIGLPVDAVLETSDLFERGGKSPHAFCTDIDRDGDVRVLANLVPTEYWMATMLHELGHAVYSSRNIDPGLPYVLRTEAHVLTTEGIAMLFQRFAKSGYWLKRMGVTVDAEKFEEEGARVRRRELLVFSRWCQVMYRFEKALYENPDRDLSTLWWDLVEKYQLLRRPARRRAPDYAAKIHICSAPVYYHNYLMGELFASQVLRSMAREIQGRDVFSAADGIDDRRVGDFLRDRVFAQGKLLPWNQLTQFATGAPLGAEAFAADFRD